MANLNKIEDPSVLEFKRRALLQAQSHFDVISDMISEVQQAIESCPPHEVADLEALYSELLSHSIRTNELIRKFGESGAVTLRLASTNGHTP